MHIIEMVGAMTLVYFASLLLLCLYRDRINVRVANIAFIIADFVFFAFWTYSAYLSGWLGDGFLTFGNISPLMFTTIMLLPFMNRATRSFAEAAIAYLSLGMFLAMLISPEHAYLFNYLAEANLNYTAETACHMLCSLFGIYLIISGQVQVSYKNLLKSMAYLYSIISFAVVMNFLLHRDYFGMDPYGDYRIYMIDIFGSFEATLVAYYFGIFLVLAFGMHMCSGINKMVNKIFGEHLK
ncbi:MAG: hypothetical protein E7617_06735 [Ruminococcaceae bacterium]|nr:hypothetical protein [Oscillospiraceae bacterium]